MDFFDILFPLNIGPLTYRCPEALSGSVKPGIMVSAPLKNRISKGIVIGKSPQLPPGAVKDIQEAHGETPILSENMICLLKWMSDYYLAEQGLVLKSVLPKETFVKVKQRKRNAMPSKEPPFALIDTDDRITAKLLDSINSFAYDTFLLYSPSSAYELSLLLKTVPGMRNAIILVPEVSMIRNIYPALRELLGERISLFHSELSGGQRSESIRRIISGRSDVVLGTRSAIFAPLGKVSFIAVLHEHSTSYKQENSPCYSARDVAVMRGYIEKSTVLLSSICPSVESLFNCKTSKYHLLRPAKMTKPRIRVIDMNHEKLVRPYLSKTVIDGASRHVKDGKAVVFILNRRGHSTLLQCVDCGRIEECPHCKIPLVFHKQDISLKCHYCGYALSRVPELCSGCKGHNLKLSGAGTQRVQEDIEELTRIKTVRIDSDKAKRKTDLEKMMGPTFVRDQRIIVGTKLMTGRLGAAGGLSMAAVLNIDLFLNIPDFRSAEKAYQEIAAVASKIEPGGEVFVQTRMPQNYLFRHLKNYDYDSFFKEELNRRKALAYPPYARLLLMKLISERDVTLKLSEVIHKMMTPPPSKNYKGDSGTEKGVNDLKDVEILGPYTMRNRQGKEEVSLLLKSPVRANLHETATTLIENLKEFKDVRIKVDVDPIVI